MGSRFLRALHSLVGRLVVSQLLVALAALTIAIVALTFGIRPIQRELLYRRLVESHLPTSLFVRTFRLPPEGEGPAVQRQREALLQFGPVAQNRLFTLLQEQAEVQNLRALLLSGDGNEILHDTAGVLTGRSEWDRSVLRLRDDLAPGNVREASAVLQPVRGVARLGDQRWLVTVTRLTNRRFDVNYLLVMMAPEPSAQAAVQDILQALPVLPVTVVLGGLVAIIALLSLWLSRSVARGLEAVVAGTHQIATGELDYRVPVDERTPDEFRRLAVSFNRMAEEVQHSRQAQRDFVANVSHDLRTPLTSIHGFAQALLDGTAETPDAQRRAVQIIHDESRRLIGLVGELLELARLDSGRLQLRRQPVALNEHLEWLVDSYRSRCAETHVNLVWQPGPSTAVVHGDPDRLTRIFSNLLENALKFTPAHGTITVGLQAGERIPSGWEVFITDTGPGIPAADLPYLFDRFYQVDKARSQKSGSGLGLAIVHELVAAHGGQVGVESVEGLGSRFWVWLPAWNDARSEE